MIVNTSRCGWWRRMNWRRRQHIKNILWSVICSICILIVVTRCIEPWWHVYRFCTISSHTSITCLVSTMILSSFSWAWQQVRRTSHHFQSWYRLRALLLSGSSSRSSASLSARRSEEFGDVWYSWCRFLNLNPEWLAFALSGTIYPFCCFCSVYNSNIELLLYAHTTR